MIFNIYSPFCHNPKKCIVKVPIMKMMYTIRNFVKRVIFPALLIMSTVNALAGQDNLFTVTGIVLSGSGRPVPDVTISIEGSADLPVVTGEPGTFTLQASSGDVWVIISPVGDYKEQRIYLNYRDHLTIYLTPADMATGYDEIKLLSQPLSRRNIIAAFADPDIRNIHHTSSVTVDQYMQGRVPGMHIENMSGTPASATYSMVRGQNSIHASTQPLYVLDGNPILPSGVFGSNLLGFAYNPLTTINPLDISKVTVVKDPAISAAYGSKGSNGIVFIETLDPDITETVIDIDIRSGYSLTPGTFIPQLNAQQHKTLMNEILFTSPMPEEQIRLEYPNLFLEPDDDRFIDYQHNTSWQELIYNNSYFSNINVQVKGGDEIARYGLSFGYLTSNGIIKTTGYEGYNLRFVTRMNMFSWLGMDGGVALNSNSSALKESTTTHGTSPILTSLARSPLLSPFQYDFEGKRLTRLSEVDELGISNPLATINNYTAENDNYNFIANMNFNSTISGSFSLFSNFSFAYNVMKETIFMPNQGMALYYNQEAINVSKATNNSINTFYNNTYALYHKTFGNHNFSSTSGVNIQTNNYELDWGLTKNAHQNDRYRSIQHGQFNLRELGGQNRLWNWISLYEYLNYSYQDKYLLSASVSLDGSSRVGENAGNTISLAGQPFGLFYGAGAGWRISSEPFMRDISWVEELKLRASMGKTGNDDIGEASATRYYQAIRYRETAGLFPAVVFNDRLTYETVTQMNAGLDISLRGSRVSAKFDVFNSTVEDMLIFSPLPPYMGYDAILENGGTMENQGWEVNSFIRLADGYSLKWDVQASLSSVKNQVTSIKGDRMVTALNGAQVVNQPGAPVNSFYGLVYQGVYKTREQAANSGLVNDRGLNYQAGDAIYADISGPDGVPDGAINDFDKTIIGSSIPEYFGGLLNSFQYRRWAFSSYAQFVAGNDVFNYVRYQNEKMTGLENQSTATLNRWQYDGHDTEIPRALWNDPIGNSAFSSRWIEDASYIRIKNITLSYRIPRQFLAFRNAEFYLSANNVFVFSNYLGYDPEFAHSYANRGIDYGQSPQPRQFIGGIKFGL
jgi:TonB-linked SusC/RagA family outer membrane protein